MKVKPLAPGAPREKIKYQGFCTVVGTPRELMPKGLRKAMIHGAEC